MRIYTVKRPYCFFEEDGGIILLDYKTDYVSQNHGEDCNLAPALENIMEKYRTQIEYYGEALRRITGKPITGKYLYLFHTGDIIDY